MIGRKEFERESGMVAFDSHISSYAVDQTVIQASEPRRQVFGVKYGHMCSSRFTLLLNGDFFPLLLGTLLNFIEIILLIVRSFEINTI